MKVNVWYVATGVVRRMAGSATMCHSKWWRRRVSSCPPRPAGGTPEVATLLAGGGSGRIQRGPDGVRSEGMFQPSGHTPVDQLAIDEHAGDPLHPVEVHQRNPIVCIAHYQRLQDLTLGQVLKGSARFR